MYDSSSYVIPTPLAHADTSRDVLPRGGTRRFTGNRYTIRATINENDETSELNSTESASAKKLESSHTSSEIFSERLFETSKDNRIVSWTTLISFFAIVCCPDCYSQGLELIEDSVSGLCSHMNLKCKNCSFFKGFPYDREDERFLSYKLFNCFGAKDNRERIFSWQKVMCFPRFTFPVKTCFPRSRKRKLLKQLNALLKKTSTLHGVKSKAQIVSLNVEYPLMVLGNAEATHL
ncbi:hypothetical protein TNCV_2854961 [Trichonephila clavipes]|nr:hypothetical protein TNCV_2854961 [Trichonephila clavipes]